MPCPAIILTGDRAGHVCSKGRLDIRCGNHESSFLRDRVGTARKEIHAYAKVLGKLAGPTFTIAFARWVSDWRDERIALIENEGVAVGAIFPYGPAPPDAFDAVYNPPQPVEDEPAPPPPPRRRNPPRRARGRGFRDGHPVDHALGLIDELIVGFLPDVPPPPPPPAQELARFAADKQNVHTTQSVEMTKQVVEVVLKIPVPEEYRWNLQNVSKTAGEIITECKLTPDEMVEMLNRYIRDDDVYEMGKGIYGKVLDGVWQYIRNSPDKADLCRILKQELKDNIGMCAQGNLSRLCNVLAGYVEGIGPQESVSERLGRELPLLMDDEDRVNKAKTLMKSLNVPEADWAPWLDMLA